MTDDYRDGWISKSNNNKTKNNFVDPDYFCIAQNTLRNCNNKLKLGPSCFPSSCICGHLCEFRKIDFFSIPESGSDVAKIPPVNITLRSGTVPIF